MSCTRVSCSSSTGLLKALLSGEWSRVMRRRPQQQVGQPLAELAHLVGEGAVLPDAGAAEGAGQLFLGAAEVVGRRPPGRPHPRRPPGAPCARAASAAAAPRATEGSPCSARKPRSESASSPRDAGSSPASATRWSGPAALHLDQLPRRASRPSGAATRKASRAAPRGGAGQGPAGGLGLGRREQGRVRFSDVGPQGREDPRTSARRHDRQRGHPHRLVRGFHEVVQRARRPPG